MRSNLVSLFTRFHSVVEDKQVECRFEARQHDTAHHDIYICDQWAFHHR